MKWKIGPSGCTERKGRVQVRIDFFLDPTDLRYEAHHKFAYMDGTTLRMKEYIGEV